MPSRHTRVIPTRRSGPPHRLGGGQALLREGRRQLDRPRPNLTYLNVSAASRGILGNKSQEKDP